KFRLRSAAMTPATTVSSNQTTTTQGGLMASIVDSSSTPATATAPTATPPRTTANRMGATVSGSRGRRAIAAAAIAIKGSNASVSRAVSAICVAWAPAGDPTGAPAPGRRRRAVDVQLLDDVVADLAGDAHEQLAGQQAQ